MKTASGAPKRGNVTSECSIVKGPPTRAASSRTSPMARHVTSMQAAAREWADMPRALVAARFGLRSSQAVSMRLRRARERELRLGLHSGAPATDPPRTFTAGGRRLEFLAAQANRN